MKLNYRIQELRGVNEKVIREISSLMRQLDPNLPDITENYLCKLVNDQHTKIFIALNGKNKIIGALTMIFYSTLENLNIAWIEGLIVNSDYRRKGIGHALLKKAIRVAKKMRINSIRLTSRPSRLAANLLYKKIGFKLYNTNFYKYDFKER